MLRNLPARSRSLLAALFGRTSRPERRRATRTHRRRPIAAEQLESRAMLAGMVIDGGLSWNGWTYRGLSNEGGLYGSGGTSERYEVYTVTFAFAATSTTITDNPVQAVDPAPAGFAAGRFAPTPAGPFAVSKDAFADGNTILGIGVRVQSGGSIAGFKPTLRFDLDNDSYTAASFEKDSLGRTTSLKNDGRTSFGSFSERGDFTVQFEGGSSWRGSAISVQAGDRTGQGATYTGTPDSILLPGGVGSGTSYDFAFRAFAQPAANAYQMFIDMSAIPTLYGSADPTSVYNVFFPNKAGVGTIGDRVTVSLNGLGSNNVVLGADLTLPVVTVDVSPDSVEEDAEQPLTYTFTRSSGPATDLVVSYAVGGTATAGLDYSGLSTGSGVQTVTIPAGQASATTTVFPLPDDQEEPDESLDLVLLPSPSYLIRWPWTARGTIKNVAPGLDLDVDSDNDNRLNTPERDDDEEKKEPTTPKRIVVNDNDTDRDSVPDYADWAIADKRFTPLVVQIPAKQPIAGMQLTVSYPASDPGRVGPDRRLPADSVEQPLRIWTKNASENRNIHSVIAGGHFVPAGTIDDLTTLGFTDANRTVELYVEGVAATAGVSQSISITLTVPGKPPESDLVTVVVVSNTLVIGIDGTDSAEWLAKKDAKGKLINERTMPDGSTRWNSHVRNLVADCEPFAMTYYTAGPDQQGLSDDSGVVFRRARDAARSLIQDAGGGTTIALVGWSRGAMIASGVAHDLLKLADGDLPRTVAFIGMYDPVDESNGIPPAWATIHADVQAVTIVGPTADRQTRDEFNVDYPVSGYAGLDNWTFERMARGNRITTAAGATTELKREVYNASHGAIGGTPGYNKRHRDGGEFPENYDYTLDVQNSIRADKDIRAGMRAAGLTFVPDRDAPWYRFPAERPPEDHRE
ncbi:MAG: hypothetical protein ACK5SI_04840 [Planctomycetia bacterium]